MTDADLSRLDERLDLNPARAPSDVADLLRDVASGLRYAATVRVLKFFTLPKPWPARLTAWADKLDAGAAWIDRITFGFFSDGSSFATGSIQAADPGGVASISSAWTDGPTPPTVLTTTAEAAAVTRTHPDRPA